MADSAETDTLADLYKVCETGVKVTKPSASRCEDEFVEECSVTADKPACCRCSVGSASTTEFAACLFCCGRDPDCESVTAVVVVESGGIEVDSHKVETLPGGKGDEKIPSVVR